MKTLVGSTEFLHRKKAEQFLMPTCEGSPYPNCCISWVLPFYNYPTYCLASFAIVMNLFSVKKPAYCMSSKKEIEQPLDTEQAKNLELDETPKPTRKVSKPSVPVSNNAEPSTHDKIKGRRVIK